MIIGIEQHKKLRKLSFPMVEKYIHSDLKIEVECTSPEPYEESVMRLPTLRGDITISEALDWIRGEKGIMCCAFYMVETIANGLNKTLWYIKYGIADQETIYNSYNVDYKYYYTHPLAESALLDSLLTYLEENNHGNK